MKKPQRTITFVDAFSNFLDDLPKRMQRSTLCVLRYLSQTKGFSVFEVTANDTIATTIDRVIRLGYISTTPQGYPWTDVELTKKGVAYLQDRGVNVSPPTQ